MPEPLPATEVAFRRSIGFRPWSELTPEVRAFIIKNKIAEQPEIEWWRATEKSWRVFGPWSPGTIRSSKLRWILDSD